MPDTIDSSEPASPALALGDKITLDIHDLAFGGEGVGRWNDFVVFAAFTTAGDQAEVEIIEVKKRFARGRLVRLIRGGPSRVDPLCPFFGQCGGCQYQHIDYSAQLALKHKQVSDLFQRIGGLSGTKIMPVVPCPQPYGYRNRVMIRSQWDKFKQGLNIGFLRADNRLVIDLQECKIAEPALNEAIQRVRKNPPPKGGIKVTLRVPPEGWELPRDSFFQNNFHLLPKLVETVRDCLRDSGSRHLIDVYCGVGFFAIEAADLVDWFIGIELDKPAIQAARRNAANRGLQNGDFIDGDAAELLPTIVSSYPASKCTVLLDPPRKGCPKESVELLLETRPRQIIYVSCQPATLARDLQMFTQGGVYRIEKVVPLDMFPQTQHLECVADLRLADCNTPVSSQNPN